MGGAVQGETCWLDFCICRIIEYFNVKQLKESSFFYDIFLFYPGAGVVKDEEMAMHWFR